MAASAAACVGREPVLAALRDEIHVAAQGRARVVWIDGEPGVGKTTLVRALLADAEHRVAWVSADEEEMSLDYGVLTSLALAIEQATGSAPFEHGPLAASMDPLAVGAELLVALGTPDSSIAVVVDDLQWADARSAAALRFALRRLLAERVSVFLITRPHPEATLGEWWGRFLSDAERVVHVRLDGLDVEGMTELVAVTGHGDIDLSAAERLCTHTGGNPLHARALLDEIGPDGLATTGLLPAPHSFAQLTVSRLAALGPDVANLVSAGAVLGSSFPSALAAELGGVVDVSAALDAAVQAGLLERMPGGEVRFSHPLVRGAVYTDLSTTRLRALHQAAAVATTGDRSLDHRIAAAVGYDDDLADELARVAGEELAAGATAAAHDHLRASARLSSDRSVRDRRLLEAVEVLVSTGDYLKAYALRDMVLACEDSAYRSFVLGLIDPGPDAESHFATAVERAEREDAWFLRLKALAGLAIARVRLGRFEAALGDVVSLLASSGDAAARADAWGVGLVIWVEVVCLAQLGRTGDARAALARPMAARSPNVDLDRACTRGVLELVDDDLAAAERELRAVAERVRSGESSRVLGVGLSALAGVEYLLGRWDDAAVSSERAVVLSAESGRWVALAHTIATFVHAGRGRFDVAEEHVRGADATVRALPSPAGLYYVAMARAALAQARGDVRELAAATAPLLDGSVVATVEGLDRWSWRVLTIEGLLGCGELAAARSAIEELATAMAEHGLRSPRADLARLRGALAEASGDVDAALAEYGSDQSEALPLPGARLALAYGSLLRRTGGRRDAIEHLRAAHRTLTALGAAPFLVTCEAELVACGLRSTGAPASNALQLTASEEGVAHLVAQGMTNREVAARLYISPNTVDFHLRSIFAKLGIKSRRELARRYPPAPG